MEPNTYHELKPARKFRTEAEYRLWQTELAYYNRPVSRPSIVSRMFAVVRNALSRRERTQPEMARPVASARQTQTIARVTE